MSAHRYWRLLVSSTDQGAYVAVAEIQFRGEVGGASLFGSGTPSASSVLGEPTYGAAMAVDGNTATFWQNNSVIPCTWQYDFGAGNDVDLAEVYILPRQDSTTLAPQKWSLLYSDDGTNWTTAVAYCGRVAWTTSAKTFAAYYPAAVSGGHQYWRINIKSTSDGSYGGFSEIELRPTDGGSDQCGLGSSGVPAASSTLGEPTWGAARAVDGTTSTYWMSASGIPCSWQYDFGTAQKVLQVAITPRLDALTIAPAEFDLDYSDNGADWTTLGTFTDISWPDTDQQLFTAVEAPTGPTPAQLMRHGTWFGSGVKQRMWWGK